MSRVDGTSTEEDWFGKEFRRRARTESRTSQATNVRLALLARLWFFFRHLDCPRTNQRRGTRVPVGEPGTRGEGASRYRSRARRGPGHSCRARDPHALSLTPIAMASSAMAASASATYAGAALTHRRASVRASRGTTVVVRAAEEKFDARAFRRELSKSPKYNRKFEKDQESAAAMETAGIGMVSKGASARVTVREAITIARTREIAPHRTSARPTISARRDRAQIARPTSRSSAHRASAPHPGPSPPPRRWSRRADALRGLRARQR